MATKIRIAGEEALAVYDDRWRPLLEALGPMKVTRATEVEFDEGTGDWVARLKLDGRIIARGKVRADVVRAEVEWLEQHVI